MSGHETISITCCFQTPGEIDASIKELFDAVEGPLWKLWRGALDTSQIYKGEPPAGIHPLKYAIWEPRNKKGGSCLMTNRQDGGDTIVYNLSRLFAYKLIKVYISANSAAFPFCSFTYFENGSQIRHIHAMLDGKKWVFFESGAPFSFEDQEGYKKSRIRDRLTPAHIRKYLKELGWDIEAEGFWNSSEPAFFGEQLACSSC